MISLDDLTGVQLSLRIDRRDRTLEFSTRKDYYNLLQSKGLVNSYKDFMTRSELVLPIQQHWMRKGDQVGCWFAHYMAKAPQQYAWHRVVVTGEDPESWPIRDVDEHIADAIADEDIWALSVIFPQVETDLQLVQLIREISRLPNWTIDPLPSDEQNAPGLILLALRRTITPSNEVHTWPLVFGPYPEVFPLTRLAPFTEIAFAVKPKKPPLPRQIKERMNEAHLADVPVRLAEGAFTTMWNKTGTFKRQVLGGKDPRARASVSVSIPADIWDDVAHE